MTAPLPITTYLSQSSRKQAFSKGSAEAVYMHMPEIVLGKPQAAPDKKMPVTAVFWSPCQKRASCSWEKLRQHTVQFLLHCDSKVRLYYSN